MTRNQESLASGNNVRAWKYGELPMPDWVPRLMASGIEANGTFEVDAEGSHVRVHPGDMLIERSGTVWVRPVDEASNFIKKLGLHDDRMISGIGPGKAYQFGFRKLSTQKGKRGASRKEERRPTYPPPVGSLPSIEWIHVERLSIDSTYQRSTQNEASRRLIASIAARFDWRLCVPLVVSRRADDSLVIIDGQHRWMAVSRRTDIPQLPCCVFKYASIQEEARMFIVANRACKPINRLDDYYAALAAADEDALEIHELVTSAGLSIARSTSAAAWRAGEIAFTASIASAIRRFGPAIALNALTDMAVAFAGQKLTHGGAIFGALVRILVLPRTEFDPDSLMGALQSRTADEWGSYASGLTSGDRRVAALRDAIMAACNDPASATA